MYVTVCGVCERMSHVWVPPGARRAHRMPWSWMDLGVAVSLPWLLGTQLRRSGRADSIVDREPGAVPPACTDSFHLNATV